MNRREFIAAVGGAIGVGVCLPVVAKAATGRKRELRRYWCMGFDPARPPDWKDCVHYCYYDEVHDGDAEELGERLAESGVGQGAEINTVPDKDGSYRLTYMVRDRSNGSRVHHVIRLVGCKDWVPFHRRVNNAVAAARG